MGSTNSQPPKNEQKEDNDIYDYGKNFMLEGPNYNNLILYILDNCKWCSLAIEEFEKEGVLNLIRIVVVSRDDENVNDIFAFPTLFNETNKQTLVGFKKPEIIEISQRLKIQNLMLFCNSHILRILVDSKLF